MSEHDRLSGPAETLVAHLLGHVGPMVHAVPRVEVGTADSAAQHLQANLPRAGRRLGPVGDGEGGVLADD